MEGDNQEVCQVNYSDDQSNIDEQQYYPSDQDLPVQKQGLIKAQVGSAQLIYIMFSFYRKQCEEIATQHNCKVTFSISSYIVQQIGECIKEKFGECLLKLEQFMKSIHIEEVKLFSDPRDSFKFYRSPHVHELFENKNIKLVRFHDKIFGFSRDNSGEKIKSEFGQIFKSMNIFSILFKRVAKSHQNQGSHVYKIYNHIQPYLQLIIDHLEPFFKEREILATFDIRKKNILLHGNRSRYLMEGKAAVKNAIESMVALFIKDTQVNSKYIVKYLKKATLYPVYFSKFNNSIVVIISKDNILRQLISKSISFMKLIGLELDANQTQKNVDPSVGFYLIPSESLFTRLQRVREKVQLNNHDLYSHLGIRFLKQIFIQQGKEESQNYKQLLVNILTSMQENKQRFDVGILPPKEDRKPKEIDDGLKYQVISGKTFSEQLSKLLKRDVLSEKLHMKKKWMIAYNIVEVKEETTFWTVNKQGEEGKEVVLNELAKGSYLKGAKKINEDGEPVHNFQELITIL